MRIRHQDADASSGYDRFVSAPAGRGVADVMRAPNSIVFHPSGHFHEVAAVATETGDFADGRFAVNVTIMAAPRRGRLSLSP